MEERKKQQGRKEVVESISVLWLKCFFPIMAIISLLQGEYFMGFKIV